MNNPMREHLLEVAASGIVTRTRKYVEVQIGAETWDAIQDWKRAVGTASETKERTDAATIIERKARALTEEYCRGDSGPGGYVWTNKEAEWQVILLEELAEEIRNVK